MTPLKVGEPFLETDGDPEPSRTSSGRCRDWTGGTYSASHGEGTVQTTNIREDGGESRSGRLIRGLWVRSPQGPPPRRLGCRSPSLRSSRKRGRDDRPTNRSSDGNRCAAAVAVARTSLARSSIASPPAQTDFKRSAVSAIESRRAATTGEIANTISASSAHAPRLSARPRWTSSQRICSRTRAWTAGSRTYGSSTSTTARGPRRRMP